MDLIKLEMIISKDLGKFSTTFVLRVNNLFVCAKDCVVPESEHNYFQLLLLKQKSLLNDFSHHWVASVQLKQRSIIS